MASILEVFAIQFETNAKEAKQEVDEFGGELDELEGRIDDSTEASNKLGESFFSTGKLGRQALGVAATLGAAFAAMAGQAANQLAAGRVSQFLSQDIESFHAMGEALKDLTGDAKDYENSLLAIRGKLQDIQMGDKSSQEAFLKLGVKVIDPLTGRVRNPDEVFRDLFNRVNASDNKQLGMTFGMEAGLTQGTANAAQFNRMSDLDEIATRKQGLYNITDADVENGRKLAVASNDAMLSVSKIIQMFTREFGPEMAGLLNGFSSIIQDNIKLVAQLAKMTHNLLDEGQTGADIVARTIENEGVLGAAGSALMSPITALSGVGDNVRYDRLNKASDAAYAKFLSSQNVPVNSASFLAGGNQEAAQTRIDAPISITIQGDGTASQKQMSESARVFSDFLGVEMRKLGAQYSTETEK